MKAEFATRFEVIACVPKSGCTGVDPNKKNETKLVTFEKSQKAGSEEVYRAKFTVDAKEFDQKYRAYVNILRKKVKGSWVYEITSYLKNTAAFPTVVRVDHLDKMGAIVIEAPVREVKIKKGKKGRKKLYRATFFLGPAGTKLF